METRTAFELIGTIGFPSALVIYLLSYMGQQRSSYEKLAAALREVVESNTRAMVELTVKLNTQDGRLLELRNCVDAVAEKVQKIENIMEKRLG